MTGWAPEKKDTVRSLATEITHNYARGRAFIAVDGPEADGARAFADALVAMLREDGHAAFRASLGDFLLPRAERAVQGDNALNESKFRRILIEPFRLGGSAAWVPKAFDSVADREVQASWVTGPANALLVIDGALAGRESLSGLWNYSVWVEPEGAPGRGDEARARSQAVIDNADPEHPRRLFDDAC